MTVLWIVALSFVLQLVTLGVLLMRNARRHAVPSPQGGDADADLPPAGQSIKARREWYAAHDALRGGKS